jgi:hypothetical protein
MKFALSALAVVSVANAVMIYADDHYDDDYNHAPYMGDDVRHFDGERHHEPTWHPHRNVPGYPSPKAGIYSDDVPSHLNVIADKETDALNGSVGYGVYRPNLDNVEEVDGHKSVKTSGHYNRYGRTADKKHMSPVSHFTAQKQHDLDPWGFTSGSELAAKITPVTTERFHFDPYGPEVTPVTFAPTRYNKDGEEALPALTYGKPNHTPKKFERPYVPSFSHSVDADYRPRFHAHQAYPAYHYYPGYWHGTRYSHGYEKCQGASCGYGDCETCDQSWGYDDCDCGSGDCTTCKGHGYDACDNCGSGDCYECKGHGYGHGGHGHGGHGHGGHGHGGHGYGHGKGHGYNTHKPHYKFQDWIY